MTDNIASLMGRVLSGDATDEEIAVLETYFENHPEEAQQFESLKKIWNLSYETRNTHADFNNRDESDRLGRIMNRAVEERLDENTAPLSIGNKKFSLKNITKSLLKYAAIILVSVTALLYINNNKKNIQPVKTEGIKEVIAENGSRKRVLLPDGSSVMLNAGSSIQYASNFSGKIREVTLFGEAFFDVVKHPERPFIVHASNINIKVLGTAFNVKSYPDEDAIETTLIRGLVEINRQDNNTAKPIFLHPNQKVTLPRCADCRTIVKPGKSKVANIIELGKIVGLDTSLHEKELMETAWIYNRLEFRKNSFREIAKKFERWYNVKVFISDEALANTKFNGSFENETLEEALIALQKTTPFKFKINNNEVFINVPD